MRCIHALHRMTIVWCARVIVSCSTEDSCMGAGIWGGKGQGKTFQCNLAFKKLDINPIVMSAGELESGNAGEPAKLVRQRYREVSPPSSSPKPHLAVDHFIIVACLKHVQQQGSLQKT